MIAFILTFYPSLIVKVLYRNNRNLRKEIRKTGHEDEKLVN